MVLMLSLATMLLLAQGALHRTMAAGPAGGVVLDAYGGLHPFGGVTLNTAGAPYWPNQDVARSAVVLADGSGGWELDGFGGIHSFGSAPRLSSGSYWPGWDIARALVVLPDERGGYVLDGWGGIHPFGGAPQLYSNAYWRGSDVARGLDIHYDLLGIADGGWTLDAFGGIHAFGQAPQLSTPHHFPGYDAFQALHVTGGGTGAYLLAHFGIVEPVGAPTGISWAGFFSSGARDLTRDVVPVNPTGAWVSQGMPDRQAAGALVHELQNWDRASHQLRGYSDNSELAAVAGGGGAARCTPYDRTQDMAVRNYFSHNIPECGGAYVWQAYPGFRWSGQAAGENIGWNNDRELLDAAADNNINWLNSPDHYANIMAGYTQSGCGVAVAGSYQGYSSAWIFSCEFRQ